MKVKTTIFAFSGAFILAFLLSASPHFFTYRLCAILCIGMFGLSVADMVFRPFFPDDRSRWSRHLSFFSDAFPFLLLFGITTFSVAALNEKLYALDPESHSILNGFFTLGGLVPESDNYAYADGILSFLHDGRMHFNALYRPMAHLFSAVLYVLVGCDWIRHFQLSTGLLVVCIWFHGMVVARYAGRLVSLVSSAVLCWYFAGFQATFMTELSGGCIGMVAFALLLYGYFEHSLKSFGIGIVLFALSMQIRSGVLIFLPVLVFIGGMRFQKRFPRPYMSFLVCTLLMLGALSMPDLQNRLLRKPLPTVSNISLGGSLLQVIRNSDTWEVVNREYPLGDAIGTSEGLVNQMRRASNAMTSELIHHPDLFVHNYLSMIARYSPNIERYILPWSNKTPSLLALGILLSFMLGFGRLPLDSKHRTLSWGLLSYLVCCLLSLPILNQLYNRLYAASISLNSLVAALALYNLVEAAKSLFRRASLRRFFVGRNEEPLSERVHGTVQVPVVPFKLAFPSLLILLVLFGPLVLDRFRESAPLQTNLEHQWPERHGTILRHIDLSRSMYVLLDSSSEYKVQDPRVLPRGKWVNDWKGAPLPSAKTYWLLSKMAAYGTQDNFDSTHASFSVLMPESLLKGVRLSEVASLDVRISLYQTSAMYLDITEVLGIRLKPDLK